MKIKRIWLIAIIAATFFISFYFGYSIGKETTTLSFKGLPDDTVIHFEIDKGGLN